MTESREKTKPPAVRPHPDYPKLSKLEMAELPLARYEGPIELVQTPAGVEKALAALAGEKILGFDTETRPAFRKGQKYRPSLMQLGGEQTVYIFQLRQTTLTRGLKDILRNPHIIKAGVSVRYDQQELQAMSPFKPAGFIDLGDCAKWNGLPHHGLRGLAASLLGIRISKSAQRTNWALPDLTPKQIGYAATDAWIGRALYLRFREEGWLEKPA